MERFAKIKDYLNLETSLYCWPSQVDFVISQKRY